MDNKSQFFSYKLEVPSEILAPIGKPKGIALLFHGYAQMADALLQVGHDFRDAGYLIILLQAPHVFSTPRGVIVSTWMSKFNRNNEIQSQVQYLNGVHVWVKMNYPNLPIVTLGFSQGAVVAYRAFFLSEMPIECCFCVAGDLPPEIKDNIGLYQSDKHGRIEILYGNQDDIVAPSKLISDHNLLLTNGFKAFLHPFDGRHELPNQLIKQLLLKINK